MSTNVEVQAKHWNTVFPGWMELDITEGRGTGVIFSEDSNYYYVLTNNHVVYNSERDRSQFHVKDYKGSNYDAKLLEESNQPDYDLAILYFNKGDAELTISKFATTNPQVGDSIISLGQPDGQNNAITLGTINTFTKVQLTDNNPLSSNVLFEVIMHTAPITHGSSGGVILNLNLEIIGINYAGKNNEKFELGSSSFAIPLPKVKEYLNNYYYS